jgi:hypothetical protein
MWRPGSEYIYVPVYLFIYLSMYPSIYVLIYIYTYIHIYIYIDQVLRGNFLTLLAAARVYGRPIRVWTSTPSTGLGQRPDWEIPADTSKGGREAELKPLDPFDVAYNGEQGLVLVMPTPAARADSGMIADGPYSA